MADKVVMKGDVAILGGGVAGLNAARLLHRAGIPFQLFEARDRLGGRILSVDETGAPDADGFDLAPSWFWPCRRPGFANLVRGLGVQTVGQHTAGSMLFERSPREAPQRVEGVGQDQGAIRMVGGMAALVQALARDLPVGCARLNAPVTELRLVPEDIVLLPTLVRCRIVFSFPVGIFVPRC